MKFEITGFPTDPPEKDPAQEINDALEIVQLLNEMPRMFELKQTFDGKYQISHSSGIHILTKKDSILEALRDADRKRWKD